jgi:hypothetical protein
MYLSATANDDSTGVGVLYRSMGIAATVIQRLFGGLMVMDSMFLRSIYLKTVPQEQLHQHIFDAANQSSTFVVQRYSRY